MRSMQCNVEFGYQLNICSGTKENHGKPCWYISRVADWTEFTLNFEHLWAISGLLILVTCQAYKPHWLSVCCCLVTRMPLNSLRDSVYSFLPVCGPLVRRSFFNRPQAQRASHTLTWPATHCCHAGWVSDGAFSAKPHERLQPLWSADEIRRPVRPHHTEYPCKQSLSNLVCIPLNQEQCTALFCLLFNDALSITIRLLNYTSGSTATVHFPMRKTEIGIYFCKNYTVKRARNLA
jgi:hypothetical protein